MEQLIIAIRENNLNYVANNLRFVSFTYEKFLLALIFAPTQEMTNCLINGAKIDHSLPYVTLYRAVHKEDFKIVNELLSDNKFDVESLKLLEFFSTNQMIKKMLSLSVKLNQPT